MTEKTEIKVKSLVEALVAFQADNVTASRSQKSTYFKSTYASIDDVILACNQGAKYGLSYTQAMDFENNVVGDRLQTTQFLRTTIYHSSSDQCITSRQVIAVMDDAFNDSQKVGAAITYARRYSLCSLFGLATEDKDGEANTQIATRLKTIDSFVLEIEELIGQEVPDLDQAKMLMSSDKLVKMIKYLSEAESNASYSFSLKDRCKSIKGRINYLKGGIANAEQLSKSND